jgi:hypothetical protein
MQAYVPARLIQTVFSCSILFIALRYLAIFQLKNEKPRKMLKKSDDGDTFLLTDGSEFSIFAARRL